MEDELNNSEEWRPIAGYEKYYEVSNLGAIRRIPGVLSHGRKWRGRVLKNLVDRFGYANVSLSKDGIARKIRVGRIVADAFLGPCPKGMELCHLDGVKLNNKVSNLRWDTHKNNESHKIIHGTVSRGLRNGRYTMPECTLRGMDHPMRKLTECEVIAIRSSPLSSKLAALQFGVSKTNIKDIRNRRIWRHI